MSIYLGSFLVQIISFAILYWLLKKYAFGPLLGVMQKRQEKIAKQIEDAEKNNREAERLLQEQQVLLNNARSEAQIILENAQRQAAKNAEDILAEAKNEAERMKEKAVAEILLEKERALHSIKEQIANISVLIAEKIIEKELDDKGQTKLVEQFVKQVGEEL